MKKKLNVNFSSGGISTLLTIAFIVLKLCGVIDWAWVWVLAPLWISFGLSLLIILIVLLVAFIMEKY